MVFDKKKFAENCRAERARLGLSQRQVAEAIHVSTDAVINYESPEGYTPGIDKVCSLADLYNTTPNALIGCA